MAKEKINKETLEEWGVKLLTKEELQNVSSGDFIDCDALHQSLLHAGYNVEYKNVHEDTMGFLAHFFLDGEYIGAVEMDGIAHMVRDWKGIPGDVHDD